MEWGTKLGPGCSCFNKKLARIERSDKRCDDSDLIIFICGTIYYNYLALFSHSTALHIVQLPTLLTSNFGAGYGYCKTVVDNQSSDAIKSQRYWNLENEEVGAWQYIWQGTDGVVSLKVFLIEVCGVWQDRGCRFEPRLLMVRRLFAALIP